METQNFETEITNETTTDSLKNETFEPKKIGVCNYTAAGQMFQLYEILTDTLLPELQSELAKAVGIEITKEELVAYLAAPDRKKWIQTKYIEVNKLQHGGMDVYQMLNLKLIPNPEIEPASAIAKQIDDFSAEIGKKGNFYYPILQLWDEDFGRWYTTTHFQEAIEDFYTRKTQTPEQNQIIEIFERLCTVLNELAEIRVLRPEHGPAELKQLSEYVEINAWFRTSKLNISPVEGEAYTVDPYLFRQHRLQSYYNREMELNKKSIYSDKRNLYQLSV